MNRTRHRTIAIALAAALAFAGGYAAAQAYEVWALDQGTNTIYIINPDLEVGEVIVLPEGIDMPHMIAFDSSYRYAFIASPASGNTTVMRAADREVVAILPTGAGSHFAAVTPGDTQVIVDVIAEAKLVEIDVDFDAERFTMGRELILAEDPLIIERADAFPGTNPICHDTTVDGRFAYVTLGPALAEGGLVILDTESFSLARVFPQSEVRTNCGTIRSPDGRYMFLTGGSIDEGVWYVFDTTTNEPVYEGDPRGTDTHGVMLSADGAELWMVNRHSSDGIIVDPESFEIVDDIAFTGPSPDILAIGPDNRYAFITLRGPDPRSGPHAIAGDTPGVAVIDVATRELVTILEPDRGNSSSDFHGIAVRPLGP